MKSSVSYPSISASAIRQYEKLINYESVTWQNYVFYSVQIFLILNSFSFIIHLSFIRWFNNFISFILHIIVVFSTPYLFAKRIWVIELALWGLEMFMPCNYLSCCYFKSCLLVWPSSCLLVAIITNTVCIVVPHRIAMTIMMVNEIKSNGANWIVFCRILFYFLPSSVVLAEQLEQILIHFFTYHPHFL